MTATEVNDLVQRCRALSSTDLQSVIATLQDLLTSALIEESSEGRGVKRACETGGMQTSAAECCEGLTSSGTSPVRPPAEAYTCLSELFHYSGFRPGQEEVLHHVMQDSTPRKDVIAIMPTSAGKSMCYQIPGFVSKKLVIVASPLKALIHDQVREINERVQGAAAAWLGETDADGKVIDSSVKHNHGVCLRLAKLCKPVPGDKSQPLKFLFVTPELVSCSSLFHRYCAALYSKELLHTIVIDEAHCAVDWGYTFRESYLRLNLFRLKLCKTTPILAMTATASPATVERACKILGLQTDNDSVQIVRLPSIRANLASLLIVLQ